MNIMKLIKQNTSEDKFQQRKHPPLHRQKWLPEIRLLDKSPLDIGKYEPIECILPVKCILKQ